MQQDLHSADGERHSPQRMPKRNCSGLNKSNAEAADSLEESVSGLWAMFDIPTPYSPITLRSVSDEGALDGRHEGGDESESSAKISVLSSVVTSKRNYSDKTGRGKILSKLSAECTHR